MYDDGITGYALGVGDWERIALSPNGDEVCQMRRSQISQLAEEAIKLAQFTVDPVIRQNLIAAAESLRAAAGNGSGMLQEHNHRPPEPTAIEDRLAE